ncbi:MAG: YifB family Mg chelatase-like AAA ATPase [Bacteroidales bacterium]|nr:YifB family Mg chelatase-like AAA ATPase [Bacteroidales bacterium]
MVVTSISATLQGIEATPVYCETSIALGCRILIIGLPDTAVKESRDRIESAMREVGLKMPRKQITVNLAPADVRKEGSLYDVPIAVAIMAAGEIVPSDKLKDYMLVGELSLGGTVKEVKGCLPFAILARQMGLKGIIVPRENAQEAAVVNNLEVLIADNLKQIADFLSDKCELEKLEVNTREMFAKAERSFMADFKDVKGQAQVKRAFAIAAAGGHNLILVGPPGAGKSMMAKCLPSILPPLSLSEALETTKIHSVAGMRASTGLIAQRPFRSPHHTISSTALVGGGTNPMPGEVSLAHNGVLYLDELPEFNRSVLEVLRQPLEDRQITIARAKNTVTYPSNLMLIASMNPCPCGYYSSPTHQCTCTELQVKKYLGKISGPLLDRIDLQVNVQPLSFDEVSKTTVAEPSSAIRERVVKARKIQEERYKEHPLIHCNAMMTPALLREHCQLDEKALKLLQSVMVKLDLSARAYDRILKVARTIADYEGSENINSTHVAEAISYRNLDRSSWGQG